ncbi:MAG: carboxypeptidase-like regulatory domain-containing protein [Dysgonamonadaceae bacterium]|nr:carboxypeptidase-like regulatory domain-containing protein [Dysgonamonadaceae bacterium]
MKIRILFFIPLLFAVFYINAQGTLTGRVSDRKGEPLIGVWVGCAETGNETMTDLEGNYTLKNLEPNQIIEFVFVGHATKKVKYKGQENVNVTLRDNEDRSLWTVTLGTGGNTYNNGMKEIYMMQNKLAMQKEVSINKYFYVAPELALTRLDSPDFGQIFYLQFPAADLMFKLKISSKIDFRIFAGFYVGYNINDWFSSQNKSKSDIYFNEWDYGINCGAGVTFSHVYLKCSRKNGYADIVKLPFDKTDIKIRNNSFDFSIGYIF